ncbi:MAG: VWA domain-containing protein [Gammaproteobacteria bacterium]|nr:VWA domain-containing protein [Gammaproteobacteria bacterium]
MMHRFGLLLIAGACLALAGCGGSGSGEKTAPGHGVYMLIDTSGTYTEELEKAQQIINVTLAKLYPGDSFAVARIDTGSFSEKDIVAKVTFDERPSMANHQKRLFKEEIDKFVKTVKPAKYTDITGGILQATEFLNEKGTGRKTILIFSDMKEELEEGYNRKIAFELKNFDVVAINVTKLRTDNYDPHEYMSRIETWQSRVVAGGGSWRVTNDMDQLEKIFF